MEGTDDEKNAILGDMYFLRALIYFELNNYFSLPSTGYTVPLLVEPLGPDDRVSCALTEDVINRIETDIELARTYFENVSGIADYFAATALAARIYFFHKNYNLAYERANEVINSGNYSLETDVRAPFVPGANSDENIFTIRYNVADGTGQTGSPTHILYTCYRNSEAKGFYSLNADGSLSQLIYTDTSDTRFKAFYEEAATLTYISGKYASDQMHIPYIRLAEMYLTRAEANITKKQ